MWKKLPNLPYFILFTSQNDYSVLVTNYVKIWQMTYSKSDMLVHLKKSNSALEIDEAELLEKAINILTKPEEIKLAVANIRNNDLEVILKKSFGFPLIVKLLLIKGSEELFFNTVTLPLLKTVDDLKSSEQELQQLLKKKDKEIEEYKQESGEIALRHLKTVPFNEELHMSKHNAQKNYFETLDFRLLESESMVHTKFFGKQNAEEKQLNIKNENMSQQQLATEPSSTTVLDIKEENMSQQQLATEPSSTTVLDIKEENMSRPELGTEPKFKSESHIGPRTLPRPEVKSESEPDLIGAKKRRKNLNF